MTTQEAAKYLRRYQDWRTGKDIRKYSDAGINPQELTVAINTILSEYGMTKPLTDCTGCRHNFNACGISRCTVAECNYEPVLRSRNNEKR